MPEAFGQTAPFSAVQAKAGFDAPVGVGIDALNLHHSDWSGGLTTLVHRFGVHAFGWDAQFPRVIAELVDMGIDAIYSDHVDRLVDTVDRFGEVGGSIIPGSGPLPPPPDAAPPD